MSKAKPYAWSKARMRISGSPRFLGRIHWGYARTLCGLATPPARWTHSATWPVGFALCSRCFGWTSSAEMKAIQADARFYEKGNR